MKRTTPIIALLSLALLPVAGCAGSLAHEAVWLCRTPGCDEASMERSARHEFMGDETVHLATVRGRLGLGFDLDEDAAIANAALTDCHGTSVALPADQIRGPARHQVGEGEGWQVFVLPADLGALDQACGLMTLSIREQRGSKSFDHQVKLSHHPKIGWVSQGEIGPYDDLWPKAR